MHYPINAASLKRLGIWFDQLKAEGVYDNTSIVIVADHGYELYAQGMEGFGPNRYNYNGYVPLFLVKDFDATGPLTVDHSFMTNADAPLFAMKDGIVSPINPFTQKNLFEQVQKEQVHVYYGPWDPRDNTGTIFDHDPNRSFTVHDDIFIEENWTPIDN